MLKLVIWPKKFIFGMSVRELYPEKEIEISAMTVNGRDINYTDAAGTDGKIRMDHWNYDYEFISESLMNKQVTVL